VPLIESTLLFVTLFAELQRLCSKPNGSVVYSLHISRMCPTSEKPLLFAGDSAWHPIGRGNVAPHCDGEFVLPVEHPHTPERVGYQLVAELYAWFGLTLDSIPFTVQGASGPQINPDPICTK
jgi:hypothetical protein